MKNISSQLEALLQVSLQECVFECVGEQALRTGEWNGMWIFFSSECSWRPQLIWLGRVSSLFVSWVFSWTAFVRAIVQSCFYILLGCFLIARAARKNNCKQVTIQRGEHPCRTIARRAVVMIFMPLINSLERVGTVQNTIPEASRK